MAQQPTPAEARRRMLEAAVTSGKATPAEKAELAAQYERQNRQNEQGYNTAVGKAKGGVIKSSASRRADGIAQRGKTKGRFV